MVNIDRPLTDDERNYMLRLAISVVAYRMGCTDDIAAAALDATDCRLVGDADEATLTSNEHVIVRVSREWLTFHAMTNAPVNIEDYDR